MQENNRKSDKDNVLGIKKEEKTKRKAFRQEADLLIKEINEHVEKSREEMQIIDAQRLNLINQIQEAALQKDTGQLDKLLERLG